MTKFPFFAPFEGTTSLEVDQTDLGTGRGTGGKVIVSINSKCDSSFYENLDSNFVELRMRLIEIFYSSFSIEMITNAHTHVRVLIRLKCFKLFQFHFNFAHVWISLLEEFHYFLDEADII